MKSKLKWVVAVLAISGCMMTACGEQASGPASNENPSAAFVVHNNGGHFISHEGDFYFRQYRDGSFEKSGLYDRFPFVQGSVSDMVRLDAEGVVTTLFQDKGYGAIFLYEDADGHARFLLSGYPETSGDERAPTVYSLRIDGSDPVLYGDGSVFAVDGSKGLAIINTSRGGIAMLNLKSDRWEELVEAYHRPLYYDVPEAMLYCEDASGSSGESRLDVCRIDVQTGETTRVFSMTDELFEKLSGEENLGDSYEVRARRATEQHILMYVASFGGSGHFYYNSVLIGIDRQTAEYEALSSSAACDWFGEQAVFTYREEGPFFESRSGYYLCGVSGSQDPGLVLSERELSAIGVRDLYFDEDAFSNIIGIEHADGSVFFTVASGARNEGKDIGWRYGYNRDTYQVFKKDIATGDIAMLYSF